MTPVPEPGSDSEKKVVSAESRSRPERAASFLRSIRLPHSKLVLFTLALSMIGSEPEPPDKITTQPEAIPSATMHIKDARVNFQGWDRFEAQPSEVQIVLSSPTLRQILHSYKPRVEIDGPTGYQRVADPTGFDQWVVEQAANPQTLKVVGIEDVAEATPKELVELAMAITVENVNFDIQTAKNLESEDIKVWGNATSKSLKVSENTPIDEILENHLPVDCRLLSVGTIEVFNQLKKHLPGLSNIELQRIYSPGHVFVAVQEVTGPNQAIISFIDPTKADESWDKRMPLDKNFFRLLYAYTNAKIIQPSDALTLANQYIQEGKASTTAGLNFINYFMEYTGTDYRDPKLSRWVKNQMQEILEYLMKDEHIDGVTIKTTLPIAYHVMLRNLYLDPQNTRRPSDWHERAEELTQQIKEMS